MSFPESPIADETVTTIFVVGFPDDFREREFQNLFTFARGFEGCSLKLPQAEGDPGYGGSAQPVCLAGKTGQVIGFARFRSVADAAEACRLLNGRSVDQEKGAILKAEMAKKNLYIAPMRSRSTIPFAPAETNREHLFGGMLTRRASVATTTNLQGIGRPVCEECASLSVRSLSLSIPGQPSPVPISVPAFGARGECPHGNMNSPSYSGTSRNSGTASQNGDNSPTLVTSGGLALYAENPPCNTLYVGNLPPNASEAELRSIFMFVPGFKRMSFKAKIGSSPMCFVEFEDVTAASAAIETLYGTMLSNSTKGAIRLSFSKNPLGVRSPQILSLSGVGIFADLFPSLPTTASLDLAANSTSTNISATAATVGSFYSDPLSREV